ncbi:hypothetical protein AAX05_03350 [Moraxella bovoculi]|uniref:hypothetical protein n=1 Tax=Moraxella bovoculi TaxID=386891 RepID=UPI000624C764|nr:hypothetical protein [Moraxella bovoculi]AKG09369.1 hypothetical protein AAX05_03350 [Moraxella bovoculi]AKG13195.1 hypothetical protein AAX11_03100 [Moraxella bovoculi]
MSFKSKLLGLTDKHKPKPIPYTCPVTGEKAYIKRFTMAEREHYADAITSADNGKRNATAFTLIMCDAKGELIFDDTDIDKLSELPEDVLTSAVAAFNSQTMLTIEQAEKNSEPPQ